MEEKGTAQPPFVKPGCCFSLDYCVLSTASPFWPFWPPPGVYLTSRLPNLPSPNYHHPTTTGQSTFAPPPPYAPPPQPHKHHHPLPRSHARRILRLFRHPPPSCLNLLPVSMHQMVATAQSGPFAVVSVDGAGRVACVTSSLVSPALVVLERDAPPQRRTDVPPQPVAVALATQCLQRHFLVLDCQCNVELRLFSNIHLVRKCFVVHHVCGCSRHGNH